MKGDAKEAADGQHRAQCRLIPVGFGEQKHPDIGTESASNVGQEEVQTIECGGVLHKLFALSIRLG